MQRAKHLITSSTILIERKMKMPTLERNQINYVFCSGHFDALPVENSDRRFAVFNVPAPLHPDVYADAATEIEDGAAWGDWYRFLLSELDMGDFTPSTLPPSRHQGAERAA